MLYRAVSVLTAHQMSFYESSAKESPKLQSSLGSGFWRLPRHANPWYKQNLVLLVMVVSPC